MLLTEYNVCGYKIQQLSMSQLRIFGTKLRALCLTQLLSAFS